MCATRWITHLGSAETAHEEIAGRLLSHDCTHRRVLFTEDLHVHWEDDLNVTSKGRILVVVATPGVFGVVVLVF